MLLKYLAPTACLQTRISKEGRYLALVLHPEAITAATYTSTTPLPKFLVYLALLYYSLSGLDTSFSYLLSSTSLRAQFPPSRL